MAVIEAKGYKLLEELGAGKVKRVITAGGGSVNEKWNRIRSKAIGVPVESAEFGRLQFGK